MTDGDKQKLKSIELNLAAKMKGYHDSRQPSDEEVTIAWLLALIERESKETFTVTQTSNFCRVFALPEEHQYPQGYLFAGSKPVVFQMVDWFNPIPHEMVGIPMDNSSWLQMEKDLREWLHQKQYMCSGVKYLCVTNFGKSFMFTSEG